MDVFKEIAECLKSFPYFVEKYVKIKHPVRGLIPFGLHDYQKRLADTYEKNRFVMVKKFRQGGFTTLTAIYGLWRCLFHLDQKWVFISKTDREACAVGRLVQDVIDHMPAQLKATLTHKSDHEKTFGLTGSVMRFNAAQAVCGVACTHLVFDEAAFIPSMEQHWAAMYPTIATGGKCFVVSTVNGVGNWFEDTWHRAVDGKNNFVPFDCHYTEHPEFKDPAWVAKMKENLGEKGFLQEMEGQFIGTHDAKWHEKQQKLRAVMKLLQELFDE